MDKMRDDAIREAARNHAGDEYFNADRAYLLVSPYSGRIFDAGFDRGWQAAQAESMPVVNQCDGCCRGLTVDDDGIHRSENGFPVMVCERPVYNAAELERLRNRVARAERDLSVVMAEGHRLMCDFQEQVRKTCAALKQRNDAEQERDALRKDAERWRAALVVSQAALCRPDTREPRVNSMLNAYMRAVNTGVGMTKAIDAAIAAEGDKK